MIGGPRPFGTLFENEMAIAAQDFKFAADDGIADVKTPYGFKILNGDGVGPDLPTPPAI
jgi:hypothetical protein